MCSELILTTRITSSTALTPIRSHNRLVLRRVGAVWGSAIFLDYGPGNDLVSSTADQVNRVGGMWERGDVRVVVDDGVGIEVLVTPAAVDAPDGGPGLLLLHGIGGAKEDFASHLEALAAVGPVVSFDHRGHGSSDHPEDVAAYSLDRMAADTLAVADAAGLRTFRLLGHSMGGMVSRRVLLAAPDRVTGHVLMATSPGPPPGMDSTIVGIGAEIALRDGIAELKRVMDAFDPLGSTAYRRMIAEDPGYREYVEWKWSRLSGAMYAAMLLEIDGQPDQLDALAGVDVPTLVVVGEEDATFVAPSRAMAAAIPGAELAVIPDAGHSPQFENPHAWRKVVVEFLRGAAAPRPRSPWRASVAEPVSRGAASGAGAVACDGDPRSGRPVRSARPQGGERGWR
jgi:pimeloyl-ACP methyl ester carboxylesterase